MNYFRCGAYILFCLMHFHLNHTISEFNWWKCMLIGAIQTEQPSYSDVASIAFVFRFVCEFGIFISDCIQQAASFVVIFSQYICKSRADTIPYCLKHAMHLKRKCVCCFTRIIPLARRCHHTSWHALMFGCKFNTDWYSLNTYTPWRVLCIGIILWNECVCCRFANGESRILLNGKRRVKVIGIGTKRAQLLNSNKELDFTWKRRRTE